jgi:hypothetical protein
VGLSIIGALSQAGSLAPFRLLCAMFVAYKRAGRRETESAATPTLLISAGWRLVICIGSLSMNEHEPGPEESRVAGVTEQKRHRHYGHAAELVATCVGCDKTGETTRWAAALQDEYERFATSSSEH